MGLGQDERVADLPAQIRPRHQDDLCRAFQSAGPRERDPVSQPAGIEPAASGRPAANAEPAKGDAPANGADAAVKKVEEDPRADTGSIANTGTPARARPRSIRRPPWRRQGTALIGVLAGLTLDLPILQAPMAGVSTPAMAAAVNAAGGLGAIALGANDPSAAARMIAETRERTDRPFNVNLFVHAPPKPDPAREAAWCAALRPAFAAFDAEPPHGLRAIYPSFAQDDAMLALLVAAKPAVVSFHFGLPDAARIAALKMAGCLLLASVTSLAEAQAAERVGIDALVAQGYEAGGHRGVFDPDAADDRLGTLALTRLLILRTRLPVIAAGGIMDGAGVSAALALGAVAAQLGTAFIACPESAADEPYRAALMGEGPRIR